MAGRSKSASNSNSKNGAALGFKAQLWAAADKMRGHMDASEYKHVCLGLIFLKYISDAFEEKRQQLLFGLSDPKSDWFIKDEPQRKEAAENRDEYLAANVFWLPPEARWHTIKAKAKSPEIGKVIDDAMGAIERENPTLKGVLPRDYARSSLDKVLLGGLVDIISKAAGVPSPVASRHPLPSDGRGAGGEGDRRAGVIWHTQGSGKSLSMVFYAGKIVQHPAMENPTIVVLTDRNDLDDQLFDTFSFCKELLRQTPVQAESREHLRTLLNVASGGV